MSTVQEIESAIEQLPFDKKLEIHGWLEAKLGPACPPEGYFADAYKNWPDERVQFEEAMAQVTQHPER